MKSEMLDSLNMQKVTRHLSWQLHLTHNSSTFLVEYMRADCVDMVYLCIVYW